MNPPLEKLPTPEQTLRKLFMTLFLRGRTARRLRKETTPKSMAASLAFTLFIYALLGCLAFLFLHEKIFGLSLYLHGLTLVFLAMTIATSAGEVLFNKDEAEILLHRPVTAGILLRAKISVLLEMALWMAGSFNLVGLFVGVAAKNSGWLFLPVHLLSVTLEALFCTGAVVLTYELTLRWVGREKLQSLLTTVQVGVAMLAVISGQVVPRMVGQFGEIIFNLKHWWVALLPPAWFAGLDDALVGSGSPGSWLLAGLSVVITALVLWLAFGSLAEHYETGLQSLNESAGSEKTVSRVKGESWLSRFVRLPPLSWWLHEPATRASFLLTASYLWRDREVKLRLYPGIAPMLAMPMIILLRDNGHDGGFGMAFAGSYLGLIPLLALTYLQYSQQWQAADVFRLAPSTGPARLCEGARLAVFCFLVVPVLAILIGIGFWFLRGSGGYGLFLRLLPGVIVLPLYLMFPHHGGQAVPFSVAGEQSQSAKRGLQVIIVMILSGLLAMLSNVAWRQGLFPQLLFGEVVVVAAIYWWMKKALEKVEWKNND